MTSVNRNSNRVLKGKETQELLANYILNSGTGISSVEIAPPRSQAPDIVFTFENQKIQCEIKSSKGFNRVSLFDNTITRKAPFRNKMLPLNNLFLNLEPDFFLTERNSKRTRPTGNELQEYVDYIRSVAGEKEVGFYGDKGISSQGGKILSDYFKFKEKTKIEKAIKVAREHWKAGGDDFFILIDDTTNEALFFSCTGSTKYFLNKIEAPPLTPKDVDLLFFDTAGNAGVKGKVRLSMKFVLDIKTKERIKLVKD